MDDKIALFDMDGTIAAYDLQMRADLANLGFENLPRDLYTDGVSKEIKNAMKIVRAQPGWWRDLSVIQSGLELMKLCKEIGFRIGISTQAPRENFNAWGEKFEWCEKYVREIDPSYVMNITRGGKGLYYGRIFVDDFPRFMSDWLINRPRGLGLMPIDFGNDGFSHPQVLKYSSDENWKTPELEMRLKRAFERKSRED